MNSEDRDRPFIPIDRPEEALQFIQEAVKTFAALILWTKDQERVYHTYMTGLSSDEKVIYVWTPKSVDPKSFQVFMLSHHLTECYFSVSLSRANVFFKSKFLGFEDNAFRFEYPHELFKVQRRKNFRMPIPDGYTIYAEYSDPLTPEAILKRKLIDISAGGVAILGKIEEESFYRIGEVLKNFHFKVKSRLIIAEAEIRYVKALPVSSNLQGVKIGIQFKNMKPADSQFIASYVFEESRKYFSRYI